MRKITIVTCMLAVIFSEFGVVSAKTKQDIEDNHIYETEVYEDGVSGKLNGLRDKFPDGKYWCHKVIGSVDEGGFSDTVSDFPCDHGNRDNEYTCNSFDGATQCWGFASKVFYEVFGEHENQLPKQYDVRNIKVGDWVRLNNYSHSGIVLSVSGNTYTLVEANYGHEDKICWGIAERSIDTINYYKRATNYIDVDRKVYYRNECELKGLNKSYTYTGSAIEPEVELTNGNKKLQEGVDYTVTYCNNRQFGKGEIVLEGIGNYAGIMKKEFDIVLEDLEVKAYSSDQDILLDWNDVKGADGYDIYRKTDEDYIKLTSVKNSSSFADTVIESGETYTYQVVAYTDETISASQPVEVTYLSMVEGAAVAVYDEGICLSWQKAKCADHYLITRQFQNGSYYMIAQVGDVNMYLDTEATLAGIYKYMIIAVSDGNASAPSEELSVARF